MSTHPLRIWVLWLELVLLRAFLKGRWGMCVCKQSVTNMIMMVEEDAWESVCPQVVHSPSDTTHETWLAILITTVILHPPYHQRLYRKGRESNVVTKVKKSKVLESPRIDPWKYDLTQNLSEGKKKMNPLFWILNQTINWV